MNPIDYLRSLWNPSLYHGWGRKNYFEGWYFKLIDREERHRFAVIPGIAQGSDPHSFIQIQDGASSAYTRFPRDAFHSSRKRFSIWVGDSSFSMEGIRLDVRGQVHGEIRFTHTVPWPVTLFSPGAMGPYAFVPFMECYHGILSMNHVLEGSLEYKGTTLNFTGGKGYMEKDWGASFPRAWIWMQSNHFDEEFSVTASVARIPWLGSSFTGFIAGAWFRGRLYRFATYTGARLLHLSVDEETVRLALEDRTRRIEVSASRTDGGRLVSPVMGDMKGKLSESLSSRIDVALTEHGRLLYRGTGRNSGLEVAGDMGELSQPVR